MGGGEEGDEVVGPLGEGRRGGLDVGSAVLVLAEGTRVVAVVYGEPELSRGSEGWGLGRGGKATGRQGERRQGERARAEQRGPSLSLTERASTCEPWAAP